MIGGFYWLFPWNFKEIKHQPFSRTQPLFSGGVMTLLVIEDHPVLRSRLMEHFTRAGFAVDAAPDGASARDYLDNRCMTL